MGKFMKDPKKKYRDDWENLKVGDYVFDDCYGPCSGGISFGSGSLVTKITDKHIYTKFYDVYRWKRDRWNIKGKYHVGPPYAYFLAAFQSN